MAKHDLLYQTVTLPEEMHEMKVTQSQCTCQPSVKLPKTFFTNTKCISNVEWDLFFCFFVFCF